MMMACCVPMLVIAVALFASGAVGIGSIGFAVACTAMMALMMGGMNHGGNDHSDMNHSDMRQDSHRTVRRRDGSDDTARRGNAPEHAEHRSPNDPPIR